MKLTKIFAMVLAVLMISSMACIFASAGETDINPDTLVLGETGISPDVVLFDFTVAGVTGVGDGSENANNALFWGKAKRFGTEYNAEDKCTSLIFSATDATEIAKLNPYATAMLPDELQFEALDYPICKIRYRANTAAANSETSFFFGIKDVTPASVGISGYWGSETMVHGIEFIDEDHWGEQLFVVNDGEWHDLYFDMSSNGLWNGTVTCLRYDFLWNGGIVPGDFVDIQYIAFLPKDDETEDPAVDYATAFSFQYDAAKDEFNFECEDVYVSPLAGLDVGEETTSDDTTAEETTAAETTAEETTATEETNAEETTAEETTAAETTATEETTAEETTAAEETTIEGTAAAAGETTAETTKKADGDAAAQGCGCGSSIGAGAALVVASVLAAGISLKKKKED